MRGYSAAAVVLVGLLALACGPGGVAPEGFGAPQAQEEEPKRGGILTVAQVDDPPGGWDPMRVNTTNMGHAIGPLTGAAKLVKPCRDDIDKLCPGLAERWEASADFTEYTFQIRDGVKWHDGQPFTAEDTKFWLELAYFGVRAGDKVRAPALFKSDLGALKGVESLNGNRLLRVTLEKPDPFWVATIAYLLPNTGSDVTWHPKHLMQPRIQAGETSVAPADVGFVGLGPFRFEKHDKGSIIQYRRFESYWEKDAKGRQLPFLDGIDLAIINDPGAMDAALRTGRIDGGARNIGLRLNAARYEALKNALGDKVWFARIEGALHVLNINSARPSPLQDARVRRAIQLWIDRDEYLTATFGGACCGTVHPGVSPDSIWPNPDWKTWPGFNPATKEKDRAEARRLMAEAGYANGFEIPYFTRRPHTDISEFATGHLAPLGVRLAIEFVDEADRSRRERAGDFYILNFQGWSFEPGVGPEQYRVRLQRHSINPASVMKHEDPKVEEYFQRLERVATNLDERVKVWRDLERYLVLEQALAIPTFQIYQVIPYRSYVKGHSTPKRGPGLNTDFATDWLDK